jgi:uncharacterized protein Yka (UPF0111/DUF47 family)
MTFDIEAKLHELAEAIELACMFQSEMFHSRRPPSAEDRKRIDAACETSASIRAEIIAAFPKHLGFVGECSEV